MSHPNPSHDSSNEYPDDHYKPVAKAKALKKRTNYGATLEHLRKQIKGEKISYGEISQLQGMKRHIPKHDVELREWAGMKEYRPRKKK